MKKRNIYILIISIVVVIVSAKIYFSVGGYILKWKILSQLDDIMAMDSSTVMFSSVYKDFDSIMILEPYTLIDSIEKITAINLSHLNWLGLESRDDFDCIFLVLKNRQVMEYSTIGLGKYKFKLESGKIYSKESHFKIERREFLSRVYYYIKE